MSSLLVEKLIVEIQAHTERSRIDADAGELLRAIGHLDIALKLTRQCARLDPRDSIHHDVLASTLYNYASHCVRMGWLAKAEYACVEAQQIYNKLGTDVAGITVSSWRSALEARRRQGFADALPLHEFHGMLARAADVKIRRARIIAEARGRYASREAEKLLDSAERTYLALVNESLSYREGVARVAYERERFVNFREAPGKLPARFNVRPVLFLAGTLLLALLGTYAIVPARHRAFAIFLLSSVAIAGYFGRTIWFQPPVPRAEDLPPPS